MHTPAGTGLHQLPRIMVPTAEQLLCMHAAKKNSLRKHLRVVDEASRKLLGCML
jgi:hypothetical protein